MVEPLIFLVSCSGIGIALGVAVLLLRKVLR